jgi:gliding motility-associated-like protein
VVNPNPIAGFITTPDEIDENEPIVNIQSNASSDVVFTKYHISDGTNFYKPNATHYLKNLDGKTKPMVVQIVSNKYGCVDTLYKVLDVKPAYSLYIPNTFTPNDDGRNDEFQAKGVGILKFSMQIYDRWGHSVFETKDIYTTWDGKVEGSDELIKQDVYIWKAQVIDILNQSHELIGHVNLVR